MRYDLISPRKKKDGGTFWHNVGVAFDRDNGGYAMEFNSLPLPDENGKVFVLMSEHKSREERRSAPQSGSSGGGGGDYRREPEATQRPAQTPVEDDSIPFAPEVRI